MRLRWAAAPGGAREVIVSKTRSPFLTEVAQTLLGERVDPQHSKGLLGQGDGLDHRRGRGHAFDLLQAVGLGAFQTGGSRVHLVGGTVVDIATP